ncbi:MFS transporter [Deinococcus yavapaiensis]|uniref:Putative MFS family arabinose efflux permease n=1 Tax=Deinococcus yavapaiensis KR-236 TaxID=694435 RepID=A0A318S8Z1_9DEIO|nr:MFS transporter [Deinococcus yavapaiensis]PYE53491.1 putative MFS family arabinose efflux permease [Deinococcus yavapaiensis KR-236]
MSAERLLGPETRALSIGLVLTLLLIAFESLAVSTVLPTITRDLGGLRLYGWAFSAFFMGYLLSTVTLGSVADSRGPTAPFTLALILFAVGLVVAGLAPSMEVFIVGRALQGLGGGGMIAVAYVAINRALPDALRARMLALLSSAWVLPALVGPYLASRVADLTSWHVVFLGLLPLLLIAAPLVLPALRRVPSAGAPLDVGRVRFAGLAALGTTLALAALTQRAWLGVALLGVAGIAIAVPALRALFPRGQWRLAGPLEAGFATRFVLTFSFFGAEAFVPLGLTNLRDLSTTSAGLVLTASALTWSTTSIMHSRFDERTRGRYRSVVSRIGVSFVAASIALMAFVIVVPSVPLAFAWLGWALGGFGMGLAFQSHTLVVMKSAPDGQEGQVSGTLQMADVLGGAIGAGLGGAFVAWLGVTSGVALLFACALLIALSGQVTTARLRAPGPS